MPKLLHINASARGEHSQSREIAASFIAALSEKTDLTVDTIDLFDGTLPQFGTDAAGAKLAVFTGAEQTASQTRAWEQAREVFDRFSAADLYLLNIPLWNHSIPYPLKQYIDLITQPGWAFGFDPEAGYSGLLTDKRAVTVYTAGVHAPSVPPQFGDDFATPYVNAWLKFIGVTDVSEIRFSPTVLTDDPAIGLQAAKTAAHELADRF